MATFVSGSWRFLKSLSYYFLIKIFDFNQESIA